MNTSIDHQLPSTNLPYPLQSPALCVVDFSFSYSGICDRGTLERVAKLVTLPETNVAPENRPSHKETSLQTIHFQGLC